jgi:hypothetical protein
MGFFGRMRLPRAEPPASPAPVAASVLAAAQAGPELAEDELEQVVGGLERVYLPGLVVAG